MPTKQLRRRHATTGVRDQSFVQRKPDAMDKLTFKYMEMCKVDSSSDSESDTSPRCSDASSKSLQLTGLKRRPLPQRLCGQHYQQLQDPYDGSSEDSASSTDGPKRQKHRGFRMKGRGCKVATNPAPLLEIRRPGSGDGVAVVHLTDIHMKSSSDSELMAINQGDFAYRARKCARPEMLELLRSPTHPGTLSKRKLRCPLGDAEEYAHRKKQCITEG